MFIASLSRKEEYARANAKVGREGEGSYNDCRLSRARGSPLYTLTLSILDQSDPDQFVLDQDSARDIT